MVERKHPEGVRLLHERLQEAADNGDEDAALYVDPLLLSNEPAEIAFILRAYLTSPHREAFGYTILSPLMAYASVPYDEEDIKELAGPSSGPSPLEEEEMKYLEEKRGKEAARNIRTLFKKRRYIDILLALYREAEAFFEQQRAASSGRSFTWAIGKPATEGWEKGEGPPLIHLRLLRAFAGESSLLREAEPTVQRRVALTVLLIHNILLDLRRFIGKPLEERTPEEKLVLLLDERIDLPEDDEIIDHLLRELSPERLLQICRNEMEEDPHSPGAPRAARLLGRLKHPDAIPALLSALLHRDAEDLSIAAEEALSRIGEATLPFIEPILREGDEEEVSDLLPLLGALPYPETVEIILSHYERLLVIDRIMLFSAMEALGSPRFIPLLKGSLKEGEPEEELFLLLCRLHQIDDPELPRIARALSQRREESKERMARFWAGDRRALVRESLPLLLRCSHCRQSYTYSVRNVIVDRLDKEMENILIRDEIVCKGCGTPDLYELTPQARLSVTLSLVAMMELSEAGQADLNEGPVKIATLAVDGKPMDPKEGMTYYRERIAREPDRPDLRVGYGNLLLFLKREDAARAEFEKALALDPLAIEAGHSLGEMAMKSGRREEAAALFERCLNRFDQGHFYRSKEEDRDRLREHLQIVLWDLRDVRKTSPLLSSAQTPLLRGEKVGRNDPCPCGSGKKYKKCCLGKTEALPSIPSTMVTEEENRLTARLISYAGRPRFHADYARARSLFFQKPISDLPNEKENGPDFGQFLDWFIHDYPLDGGSTVIGEFARTEGRALPAGEREILQEAIDSYLNLYEVRESRPERAEVRIKDLFTGEELTIRDVSGSKRLVKWDIIGTRIIRVGENLRPSAVITLFSPKERDPLLRFFKEKQEEYQKQTGVSDWKAFMKARGHLLHHYTRSRQEAGMPPLLTPERHEMLFCKAVYDVENFHGVLFRLKKEFDFCLDDEGEEEGERSARFTWLKRGRSKKIVPEGERTAEGIVIQSAMMPTPESEGTLSLGTLTVTERRLVLETISRERLDAGKERIGELLGDYVRFRADRFQTVEAFMKEREAKGERQKKEEKSEVPNEVKQAVMNRFLSRHYEEWIHRAIPALDGKSPLEMVRLPGGRERVEQLLKEIENSEERKRREGEFYMDANVLRQRLGLAAS
jgi:tetratricopeptide (TPR) repeat protein